MVRPLVLEGGSVLSKEYILAIDVGLSFCKVVVFDRAGAAVLSLHSPTPVLSPEADRSEIEPDELWRTILELIREAVGRFPFGDLAAVGVSGHGNGAYFLNADGLIPGRAVTSMDTRAETEVAALPEATRSRLADLSLQCVWPGQPGMILRWLKRREPLLFARIGMVLSCKDFISYRLTGKCHTDYSDISASGLFNNFRGDYDPEIFSLLELPELCRILPPVLRASDIRGGVNSAASGQTGLAAGTPVIGGFFDVDACIYGSGVSGCDMAASVAGTWNINAALLPEPRYCPEVRQCIRRGDGRSHLLIDSSATSAVNLEWLAKKFSPDTWDYEALEENLQSHRFCKSDPYWLPFVNGSLNAAPRQGAWLGVALAHDQRALAASVSEGICFAHRFHLENLLRSGAGFLRVRLTGGAATPAFSQLLADVCGLPVETVAEKQTGAAGVRAAALVALGRASSIESAVATKIEHIYQPGSECAALFAQRYNRFKELLACHW